MTLYKGPFGSVFGGTEPGLVFEPYVLNGLVQARQQTFRAVVKSAIAVSSDNVEKKLVNLLNKERVCPEIPTELMVRDRSFATNSEIMGGVLPRKGTPTRR